MRIELRTAARAALACAGCTLLGAALPLWAWTRPMLTAAAAPAAPSTDAVAERHADLHGRYAEARLALAIADAEKAEDLDRIHPGQVAADDLRSLRRRVDLLRAHVAATRENPHGNSATLAQASARSAALEADENLAAARAANQRIANAVSPLIVRQLEARTEVAHARLRLWEDGTFLDSPFQMMQMQIDQIVDEVQDLLDRVEHAPAIDRR
jgi:exonuclease VII large subunit